MAYIFPDFQQEVNKFDKNHMVIAYFLLGNLWLSEPAIL